MPQLLRDTMQTCDKPRGMEQGSSRVILSRCSKSRSSGLGQERGKREERVLSRLPMDKETAQVAQVGGKKVEAMDELDFTLNLTR